MRTYCIVSCRDGLRSWLVQRKYARQPALVLADSCFGCASAKLFTSKIEPQCRRQHVTKLARFINSASGQPVTLFSFCDKLKVDVPGSADFTPTSWSTRSCIYSCLWILDQVLIEYPIRNIVLQQSKVPEKPALLRYLPRAHQA